MLLYPQTGLTLLNKERIDSDNNLSVSFLIRRHVYVFFALQPGYSQIILTLLVKTPRLYISKALYICGSKMPCEIFKDTCNSDRRPSDTVVLQTKAK